MLQHQLTLTTSRCRVRLRLTIYLCFWYVRLTTWALRLCLLAGLRSLPVRPTLTTIIRKCGLRPPQVLRVQPSLSLWRRQDGLPLSAGVLLVPVAMSYLRTLSALQPSTALTYLGQEPGTFLLSVLWVVLTLSPSRPGLVAIPTLLARSRQVTPQMVLAVLSWVLPSRSARLRPKTRQRSLSQGACLPLSHGHSF